MIARIIRDMELIFFDNNKDLVLSKKKFAKERALITASFFYCLFSRLVSLDRIAVGKFIFGKCVDSSFWDAPPVGMEMRKCFWNQKIADAIATVVKALFDLDDSRSKL